MRDIKWRKKTRHKLTFRNVARRKDILEYTDVAQLQRRSADAVMITADVLTAHFGIHRRRSSEAVTELVPRCSVYWPNWLGWRQKVLKPLKTFMKLSWWCPLGHGKWHLPAIQFILTVWLKPILTPLSFHQTVPLDRFECTCMLRKPNIKGSLTRDFRSKFFFMNQCPPGP